MYFVLSPAKSMNESDKVPVDVINYYSQPQLIEHVKQLIKALQSKNLIDLKELMNISDDLAELNVQRNQQWVWSENKPFTDKNAKPAGYLFNGDVYSGLDMYNANKNSVMYLDEHLGILSGLYGILKPLDLIKPYRLEMGTKLENNRGNNLYDFWGDHITKVINERMQHLAKQGEDNVLVNLASNEYFRSIKKKPLKANIITPRFEDEKNGKYKVISFYAKKARGLMVKYAADNKITRAEDLKSFDLDGYYYVGELSDESNWTFRREEAK
ncbi:peroxide stress protein YaaA [Psychrobacter sp.]|uniref:peroxide stress protein YaaA n=1 Tax=Psychrobacter sp. TaxID=56811 RepID=UPI0025E9BD97|nr:peroxide stress protein YaaA [Psychrobacter sp.]